jgi:RNA-directed DNA polymerase
VSGKVRKLGIPTVTDRVVQAALKLVLEPIFEADFMPVSYGFRPRRRAQDAIAEIHHFGSKGYRWVLDADIEACFDSISHAALMDRIRRRIKDKRVLALVKAFLKAGILTEPGDHEDTRTGTPQGGILSPLLADIALSVLDEHLMAPWQPGGDMSTSHRRMRLRAHGSATWRVVRYADDFVVLINGDQGHAHAIREDVARALAPMGLRLSAAKTSVAHMSDGFDFLGFHIQWRHKRGTSKWYVYTFIAQRPIRSLTAKIRALTRRTSQQDLGYVLTRLNQVMHGWANYFRHAVAKHTFSMLDHFAWWRLIRMLKRRHHWNWTDVRRSLVTVTGRWQPDQRGRDRAMPHRRDLRHAVPLARSADPHSLAAITSPTAGAAESPLRGDMHGGFGERPRNGPAVTLEPRSRPTQPTAPDNHGPSTTYLDTGFPLICSNPI